jgi:hypothetical protein
MADFWNELLSRVQFIRGLYAQKKIQLKAGEGLTKALDEAEATANNVASLSPVTGDAFVDSILSCHVIWAFYDSVKGCIGAGLDVTNHLRQVTTGTIDFGVPSDAATSHEKIYFKDFEAELCVAGQLGKAGLPVSFLDDPSDPRGEIKVDDILLEVKHPNSTNRLEKLMRKFNGGLVKSDTYGVFVTAVEDAFSLGDRSSFESKEAFDSWQHEKRAEIEQVGRTAVLRAASLPRIGALVQIGSALEIVEGQTRLARYGNALVFDQRNYPANILAGLERIASVFNSDFPRYSQVSHLVVPQREGN